MKTEKERAWKTRTTLKTSVRTANKDNSPRQSLEDLPAPQEHEKVHSDQGGLTSQSCQMSQCHTPTLKSNLAPTNVNPSQEQASIKSQSGSPSSQSSQQMPQPSPSTRDKRMPPPPVDWRTNASSRGKQSRSPASTSRSSHLFEFSSSHKRPNEDHETASPSNKKRLLRSEYIPAQHTSWKPDWLETTRCYPVDGEGAELSRVEDLRGDAIYRNADRLKQVLEDECMYIPTHRVDELLALAQDTCEALQKTKRFLAKYSPGPIRIVRHQDL